MRPKQRPKGLVTLVTRSSTTLYSGMVPGLIAGHYSRDQVSFDLRQLAANAGVAFVQAEIKELDNLSGELALEVPEQASKADAAAEGEGEASPSGEEPEDVGTPDDEQPAVEDADDAEQVSRQD